MTDEQIRAGLESLKLTLESHGLIEVDFVDVAAIDAALQRLAELPPTRSGVITAAPRLTNEEDTKALWLTRRQMPGTLKG